MATGGGAERETVNVGLDVIHRSGTEDTDQQRPPPEFFGLFDRLCQPPLRASYAIAIRAPKSRPRIVPFHGGVTELAAYPLYVHLAAVRACRDPAVLEGNYVTLYLDDARFLGFCGGACSPPTPAGM